MWKLVRKTATSMTFGRTGGGEIRVKFLKTGCRILSRRGYDRYWIEDLSEINNGILPYEILKQLRCR